MKSYTFIYLNDSRLYSLDELDSLASREIGWLEAMEQEQGVPCSRWYFEIIKTKEGLELHLSHDEFVGEDELEHMQGCMSSRGNLTLFLRGGKTLKLYAKDG